MPNTLKANYIINAALVVLPQLKGPMWRLVFEYSMKVRTMYGYDRQQQYDSLTQACTQYFPSP